ncbi:SDR family NAD(P)-dependent oxidoreductase [Paenibacillus algicola]|uniref:SDR family NAD(P)-dependent oxidoreductase n=1 Tax=Paenibacillus algicola TaxID=2565926 RepID=UPI001E4F98F0|nr:SDR family NAD(P)-dependent oxidoreductase [Paenibacillus algicola]
MLQLDVTNQDSISAAAEYIRSELSRLNVLVNNAGISHTGQPGRALEEVGKSGRPLRSMRYARASPRRISTTLRAQAPSSKPRDIPCALRSSTGTVRRVHSQTKDANSRGDVVSSHWHTEIGVDNVKAWIKYT